MKKLEIKEIELEAFGKKGKVKSYKKEGKIICLEASLLDFAYRIGLTDFRVESVHITEDNMWAPDGNLLTTMTQTVTRTSYKDDLKEKVVMSKSFDIPTYSLLHLFLLDILRVPFLCAKVYPTPHTF